MTCLSLADELREDVYKAPATRGTKSALTGAAQAALSLLDIPPTADIRLARPGVPRYKALAFWNRSGYNKNRKSGRQNVPFDFLRREGRGGVTISAAGRAMYLWDYARRPELQKSDQNDPQAAARRGGSPLPESGAAGRMPPVREKDGAEGQGVRSDQLAQGECQTCKKRKYQDGSDDPGVSYQTPTAIAPETAASAVRGHEMEHVTREQAQARREGREVVSQTVSLHTAICPECGKSYISGGETRTVTRARSEGGSLASLFQAGIDDGRGAVGRYFSATA